MLKKLIPVLAIVALLVSLSSCNRGMGCPNNFSIGDVASQVVDVAPDLILRD